VEKFDMSDRERWIIYPMLFFALTLAAKGQGCNRQPVTRFDTVECSNLRIVSNDGFRSNIARISGLRSQRRLVLQVALEKGVAFVSPRLGRPTPPAAKPAAVVKPAETDTPAGPTPPVAPQIIVEDHPDEADSKEPGKTDAADR
jgi:hypothetical protein